MPGGKDLGFGYANDVGEAAEAGQREYVASDPAWGRSRRRLRDAPCNLVFRYDWNTQNIPVQAEANENVGEIDAAGLKRARIFL